MNFEELSSYRRARREASEVGLIDDEDQLSGTVLTPAQAQRSLLSMPAKKVRMAWPLRGRSTSSAPAKSEGGHVAVAAQLNLWSKSALELVLRAELDLPERLLAAESLHRLLEGPVHASPCD